MILVSLQYSAHGDLKQVSSLGHAAAGNKELCAAVSSLLRSFAIILDESITVSGRADIKGEFYCRIDNCPEKKYQWFLGVVGFLEKGLKLLQQDYPDQIRIVKDKE